MNTSLVLAAQAAQGQGSAWPMIIMMIAIFAIMWLFMIRPQQKKQKEIRNFQNALKEGDSVVTGGGIYGTVKRIDLAANKIDVEISRGVVITVDKGYVFAGPQDQQVQAK
jgi:preprotein translocase subunit YajC